MHDQSEGPLLAIVLLSYNSRKLLEEFLPFAVANQDEICKLYVVNNGSTDDTAEFMKEHYPNIEIITVKKNRGFTNGYVESLSQIKAKYYCLLSSDIEVTPGWARKIVEVMEKDPNIGICQPKIMSYHDRSKFEYAGGAGGYLDRFGYLFCKGRIFYDIEEDHGQYDEVSEVFWASGASFFVRADLYHKLGGLDDDFFAHMEEVDLCWRAKNAGYKVVSVPQSVVYHVGGSIISYGSPGKVYRNYRNSLILLTKNLPTGELMWKLPFRMILDGIAFFQTLSRGEVKSAFTIIKAHFHFHGRFLHWVKKRKQSRKFAQSPNTRGRYPKSIVWRYFILKKRKFSDLNWTV